MTDKIKIRVGFECSHAINSDHEDVIEIDREEWEELDDTARRVLLDELAEAELNNYVSSFAEVISE